MKYEIAPIVQQMVKDAIGNANAIMDNARVRSGGSINTPVKTVQYKQMENQQAQVANDAMNNYATQTGYMPGSGIINAYQTSENPNLMNLGNLFSERAGQQTSQGAQDEASRLFGYVQQSGKWPTPEEAKAAGFSDWIVGLLANQGGQPTADAMYKAMAAGV